MSKPLGVILAGGQARRMGGGDKGLLVLKGLTLLDRVIDRLGPQTEGLVLNANGNPERFAEFAQASDVIVIQSVERETVNRLATHFSDEAFLIALEKQLSDEENAGLSFWPD